MSRKPGCTLTPRQAEILAWIDGFITERHYPPTYREVMRAFGLGSPNAVDCHFRFLTKKGFISRDENEARGLVITRRLDGDRLLVAGVWHKVRFIPADQLDQRT